MTQTRWIAKLLSLAYGCRRWSMMGEIMKKMKLLICRENIKSITSPKCGFELQLLGW